MTVPLRTYGDWADFFGRQGSSFDAAALEVALQGTFESGAEGRVFELVRKCVEKLINRATDQLERVLSGGAMCVDDILYALSKYEKACLLALRYCEIRGLPADETKQLVSQSKSYVQSVGKSIRGEYENAGVLMDDVVYYLIRFERRWVACE